MYWRATWVLLGLLTALLVHFAPRSPAVVDRLYGEGLYPLVRKFFGVTGSLLPLPGIWLLGALLLVWLYYSSIRPLLRRKVTLVSFVTGLLSTAGAFYCLFYLLWGFNYFRPGVADRLGVVTNAIGAQEVKAEYERAYAELSVHIDSLRLDSAGIRRLGERSFREEVLLDVERLMPVFGYRNDMKVRGRVLKPEGLLLVLNTAGIYIPYTGEGHIDGGLTPVQQPFTLAHELAHGFGVTDEGECNFLAYLACRDSANDFVRLSGLLSYWRYAAYEFRRFFPEEYKLRYEQLPGELKYLLTIIHENNARFPELMPRLRNRIYDSYLRSNGVQEGLRSYNQVVVLSSIHFNRNKSTPPEE